MKNSSVCTPLCLAAAFWLQLSFAGQMPFLFNSTDPFFRDLTAEFVEDCKRHLETSRCEKAWDVTFNFMPDREFDRYHKKEVGAFCTTDGKRSEIVFREDTRLLSEGEFKTLFYHEMGHSHILLRGHDDGVLPFHDIYANSSIMNHHNFDSSWAWEGYVEELFTGGKDLISSLLRRGYPELRDDPRLMSAFRKNMPPGETFVFELKGKINEFVFIYDGDSSSFNPAVERRVYDKTGGGRSEWPDLVEELEYGQIAIDPVNGVFSAPGIEWIIPGA